MRAALLDPSDERAFRHEGLCRECVRNSGPRWSRIFEHVEFARRRSRNWSCDLIPALERV